MCLRKIFHVEAVLPSLSLRAPVGRIMISADGMFCKFRCRRPLETVERGNRVAIALVSKAAERVKSFGARCTLWFG